MIAVGDDCAYGRWMPQDSPSRRQDQFVVRLPDGMRERISKAAEANNRSMNAEIVSTLELHYPPPSSIGEIIEQIKRIGDLIGETRDPNELRFLSEMLQEAHQRLVLEFPEDKT